MAAGPSKSRQRTRWRGRTAPRQGPGRAQARGQRLRVGLGRNLNLSLLAARLGRLAQRRRTALRGGRARIRATRPRRAAGCGPVQRLRAGSLGSTRPRQQGVREPGAACGPVRPACVRAGPQACGPASVRPARARVGARGRGSRRTRGRRCCGGRKASWGAPARSRWPVGSADPSTRWRLRPTRSDSDADRKDAGSLRRQPELSARVRRGRSLPSRWSSSPLSHIGSSPMRTTCDTGQLDGFSVVVLVAIWMSPVKPRQNRDTQRNLFCSRTSSGAMRRVHASTAASSVMTCRISQA